LADILPAGAPFVNLPIGATEDRLLGGLDLGQALEGQAALKRGLIHQAHGGVLYIDEVNLLSDSLADSLLDVASSGHHYVERDGFSVSDESRFILLGSMNIEEGILRPQLLDRFALSLDVETPLAAEQRVWIVSSRLQFDADPTSFYESFDDEQNELRQLIVEARSAVAAIEPSGEILRAICQAVADAGVRSLRADLAALRAAVAHAALAHRGEVISDDIEAVMPLVLHHRTKRDPGRPSPPPAETGQSRTGKKEETGDSRTAAKERVFPPDARPAPELRVRSADTVSRGRSEAVEERVTAGAATRDPARNGGALDVVASFTQSFRNTGAASLQRDELVFRSSQPKTGVRFIFVVDSSGSLGAQQRMRAVKGVAAALLESSIDNKDEVAVVSFRGAKAEVVLTPCRDSAAALRVLEFLPTGGRTPLAHALELARSLVNSASMVILLTDGRANVPLTSADPWADSLEAAGKLNCSSLLVDSSIDSSTAAATEALAAAMRARLIRLNELSQETMMSVVRL
jgi:magnesium chelatase subunit D